MNENSPHKGGHRNKMTLVRRYKNLLHQPHRQINHLRLKVIHIQKLLLAHIANVLRSHSFWWIVNVFLRNSSISVFMATILLLEDYSIECKKEIMQKNAFREIWTLLSHKVLRGIRVGDYNKVPGTPFCACSRDIQRIIAEGRKEWHCATG